MLSFKLVCFGIIGLCFGLNGGGDKIGGSGVKIRNDVEQYFQSDVVKQFRVQWEQQRKAYEAAIRAALYEQLGRRSMNIYLKSDQTTNPVAAGFLITDNVIDLLIINITLRDIPELILPEVSLHLSDNVVKIDTTLRKMFLDGTYACYRNKSTVLLNQGAQSLLENSPFSFDQVSNEGEITIIAENCVLEGSALVTLIGYSVNLGYPGFTITDCKFTVEIYNTRGGSPPVIVPYFSQSQRIQLQQMIRRPIVRAVTTLLQGALFSHVNTTTIFGKDLMNYRNVQGRIFKKTSDFMVKAVDRLNKGTIIKNQGILKLPDYSVTWNEQFASFPGTTLAKLYNMSVSGLDTAYSSNRGGPYKTISWKISELIAFNRLYVKGIINCNNLYTENVTLTFAVEIPDLGVSVNIGNNEDENQDKKKASNSQYKFRIFNWKQIEFYIFNMEINEHQRNYARAFVNGYLMNTLPEMLIAHLEEIFPKAVDGEFDDKDLPIPVTPENDHKLDSCEAKGYVKMTNSNDDAERVTEAGDATGDDKDVVPADQETTLDDDNSGAQPSEDAPGLVEGNAVEDIPNEIR